jgi:hypothetical protein
MTTTMYLGPVSAILSVVSSQIYIEKRRAFAASVVVIYVGLCVCPSRPLCVRCVSVVSVVRFDKRLLPERYSPVPVHDGRPSQLPPEHGLRLTEGQTRFFCSCVCFLSRFRSFARSFVLGACGEVRGPKGYVVRVRG